MTCSGCPPVTGSTNHCARCHQGFTGLTLFDAHQDTDYSRPRADMIRCRPPRALGLVRDTGGTWGTPEGLASRERAATVLARARSARMPA